MPPSHGLTFFAMAKHFRLPILLGQLFAIFVGTGFADHRPAVDTYDYVVIGSGPGGGTLAANSAKADFSVLLLEAGGDGGNDLNETVAAFYPFAPSDPTLGWFFFVSHYDDEYLNDQYEHLTWRTTNGAVYVGLDPPANATKLGVFTHGQAHSAVVQPTMHLRQPSQAILTGTT